MASFNRLMDLQSEVSPGTDWKIASLNIFVTVVILVASLYQGLVVLPAISEVKQTFVLERDKEILHAKKIEALRKSQVTENALLLLDVRETRKLVSDTNIALKKRGE